MGKPRQILSRRRTVQNIRKIARTMEAISTSRFRQFGDRMAKMRAYTDAITHMVQHIVQDATLGAGQPLLTTRDDAPVDALVVIASNRGLCGGYNAGILRLAREEHRRRVDEGRRVEVYGVGTKTRSILRHHEIEPVWFIPQFERRVDLDVVETLADELMQRFMEGELRTVMMVHATFVSTSVQRPVSTPLLPLSEMKDWPAPRSADAGRPLGAGDYDYMPDPDTILAELLPRGVRLRLCRAFLDSMLSEQVARMAAMHLANENGGEMIRLLTMEYNRARQSTITTELAEIVTGVEAMR